MIDIITLRCLITGNVQGVWFRANTKTQADLLGLTGYAKNLADGRVEVLATGERVKIEKLYEWLQHGPELAQVTHISREELSAQEFINFVIL
jgi:acylphosphatase